MGCVEESLHATLIDYCNRRSLQEVKPSPLIPLLYVIVTFLRRLSAFLNQRMSLPVIALILHILVTHWPRGFRLHITEYALRERDKV